MESLLAPRERIRPSRADRERVAGVLRRACAEERVSIDTFSTRLDLVYAARTRAELDRLTHDLTSPHRAWTTLLAVVAWWSGRLDEIARAWRVGRATRLVLEPRPQVVIGRGAAADFVVADQTVSSRHALLRHHNGSWAVQDLGSRNGTLLNGYRVAGAVEVRPGDELKVGSTSLVLVAPHVSA